MLSALEIKAGVAAVLASFLVLAATFVAGGIYHGYARQKTTEKSVAGSEALVAQGRTFFFKSCAHCHGQDADGGEDAPSLRKLAISPAHMTLVIHSGIKGEMPSFAKKYSDQDTEKIVAYLQTLK
jgi:mono/diheme cytochrome c family protein